MKWEQFDICNLTEKEYQKYYSLMSETKRQRVDRFRFVEDKKRTVVGEMLARKLIAEHCGVLPEDILFDALENGKPIAVELNVHFSISHSENIVVCAVDDKSIGIDIEFIRPINLSVARRICTEDELYYIFEKIPTAKDFAYETEYSRLKRFFEIWTKKEAVYKCGQRAGNIQYINWDNHYIICIVEVVL